MKTFFFFSFLISYNFVNRKRLEHEIFLSFLFAPPLFNYFPPTYKTKKKETINDLYFLV